MLAAPHGRMTETRQSDPLLDRLRESGSPEDREREIDELLARHVYERIDKIVSARLRQSSLPESEREDIRSEIVLKIMGRLHRVHAGETGPIASFHDYVAVVAFNTFDDFTRRAHPLRTRLKLRVRYTLQRDPRFALWEAHSLRVCGLNAWRGRDAATMDDALHARLHLRSRDVGAALEEIFGQVREPLALDDVVTLLAASRGIPLHEAPLELDDEPLVQQRSPADDLEAAQDLAGVWEEIRALPVRQRVALLLHARDESGESVTRLLPLTGVASLSAIAEALEMPKRAFAEIWRDLPLDDFAISTHLGLTRQQVINLRRSARERLVRRMRVRGSGGGR